VAPIAITSSDDSVCKSSPVTLSVSGGSLGGNAKWVWYEGSCGLMKIGTGASITINPDVTKTYFVRAEGTCNITSCVSKTIKVLKPSVAPAHASANVTAICGPGSVNLSVAGGLLGSNARWVWYDGSCGGTFVAYGQSTTVNVTTSTTFYVRAEGTCNVTDCDSIRIKVNDFSKPATIILTTADSVCKGSNVTLSITDGTLGTGGKWQWYRSVCGAGSPVATGTSYTVRIDNDVTYFVRAEGTCNNTSCVSKSIGLYSVSEGSKDITSTSDTFCGTDVTLGVKGGKLGSGAQWVWYTGSCGGTYEAAGSTFKVRPGSSTTYFVRAEGYCNTTPCVSRTIITGTASTAPATITSSNDTPCLGARISLTVNGGTLGQGANWVWYHSSCGGSLVGRGKTINDVPNGSTVYYVRAEGPCNSTICVTKPIRVLLPSAPAAAIVTATDTILNGASIKLAIFGGGTGDNARWVWYKDSCGKGAPVGFGSSIIVKPGSSTTYFVRSEGTCNNTVCISRTVNVWGMGLDDIAALSDRVELYPNPATSSLNLAMDVSFAGESKVELLDAQGRFIRHYMISGRPGTYKLDLNGISEGQYMLVIKNGSMKVVKRFTKLNP